MTDYFINAIVNIDNKPHCVWSTTIPCPIYDECGIAKLTSTDRVNTAFNAISDVSVPKDTKKFAFYYSLTVERSAVEGGLEVVRSKEYKVPERVFTQYSIGGAIIREYIDKEQLSNFTVIRGCLNANGLTNQEKLNARVAELREQVKSDVKYHNAQSAPAIVVKCCALM